jgi:hypothetical protein
MAERHKFPGPWKVERTAGNHFVVKDATGFSLAYIYQREGPSMYDTYFTDEEAFVMANTIAKLPRTGARRPSSLGRFGHAN